jgi:hypothetical protein
MWADGQLPGFCIASLAMGKENTDAVESGTLLRQAGMPARIKRGLAMRTRQAGME